jgi:flagellar protein FliO/FliZ
MDGMLFLRAIGSLLIVLGLLGGFTVLLRRYGHKITGLSLAVSGAHKSRLSVVESKLIDGRSKLVLVRRDQVEHLLLINATGTCLVETNIKSDPII